MMEFGQNLDMDALANEQLSGDEVRELLKRLSMPQFAPETPTVAAVCEICGTTPLAVGRMLAEIRQTNLQELFGKRIDRLDQAVQSQSQQIAELKTTTEQMATRSVQAPTVVINQFGDTYPGTNGKKLMIVEEPLSPGTQLMGLLIFFSLAALMMYAFWQFGESQQKKLFEQPPFGGSHIPEPGITVDGQPAPPYLKKALEEQSRR